MIITKIGKKIIVLIVLVFIFLPVFVHAVSWWPIVPCGTSANSAECTKCDLFKLFKNIIDFVLVGLMPPVAAILFVWGGFLILMGGANPGNITQGRTIFWNTFMGVLILSSSWLISNTIIKSLAEESVTNPNVPWYQFECKEVVKKPPVSPPGEQKKYSCQNNQCVESAGGTYTEATCNNSCGAPPAQKYGCNSGNQCVADPNGQYANSNCDDQCQPPPGGVLTITIASLPGATVGKTYNQTIQVSGGATPYGWTMVGSPPAGLTFNTATGVISGTPTTAGTSTFTVKVTDNSTPQQSATKSLSIVVGTTTTGGDACSSSQTLAQQHTTVYPRKRAPELDQLLSCMAGKLGQSMPSESGSNSFYGSLYTYDQSSVLCNYTRGDKHCDSSCSHAANSCHYGGKTGTEGSLAADFGNETKGDIIIQVALDCGAKSGRCENASGISVGCAAGSGANHIHISSKSCDAN